MDSVLRGLKHGDVGFLVSSLIQVDRDQRARDSSSVVDVQLEDVDSIAFQSNRSGGVVGVVDDDSGFVLGVTDDPAVSEISGGIGEAIISCRSNQRDDLGKGRGDNVLVLSGIDLRENVDNVGVVGDHKVHSERDSGLSSGSDVNMSNIGSRCSVANSEHELVWLSLSGHGRGGSSGGSGNGDPGNVRCQSVRQGVSGGSCVPNSDGMVGRVDGFRSLNIEHTEVCSEKVSSRNSSGSLQEPESSGSSIVGLISIGSNIDVSLCGVLTDVQDPSDVDISSGVVLQMLSRGDSTISSQSVGHDVTVPSIISLDQSVLEGSLGLVLEDSIGGATSNLSGIKKEGGIKGSRRSDSNSVVGNLPGVNASSGVSSHEHTLSSRGIGESIGVSRLDDGQEFVGSLVSKVLSLTIAVTSVSVDVVLIGSSIIVSVRVPRGIEGVSDGHNPGDHGGVVCVGVVAKSSSSLDVDGLSNASDLGLEEGSTEDLLVPLVGKVTWHSTGGGTSCLNVELAVGSKDHIVDLMETHGESVIENLSIHTSGSDGQSLDSATPFVDKGILRDGDVDQDFLGCRVGIDGHTNDSIGKIGPLVQSILHIGRNSTGVEAISNKL